MTTTLIVMQSEGEDGRKGRTVAINPKHVVMAYQLQVKPSVTRLILSVGPGVDVEGSLIAVVGSLRLG